jgi:hypothetical protein
MVQWVLLSLVFSVILAVLTFYGSPTELFRNRVFAVVLGLFLGIPSAAVFVLRMSSPPTDE